MHVAKIPELLVLLMVVSAFATALAAPVGDPADSIPAASPASGIPDGFPSDSFPAVGPAGSTAAMGSPFAAPSAGGPSSPAVGSSGKSVLIYGPSIGALLAPPWDYNEETVATALGHSVVVADAQAWLGLTTADFASFDAIVFGDPKCEASGSLGTVLLEPANTNKAVWSPAITGPMVVIGTTPQFYQFNPNAEDRELIANGIGFASSGFGTGLYVSLSCYFLMEPSSVPVDFLSEVGEFRVGGRQGCTEPSTIADPTHPAMLGLTTLGQPDWGCASQEIITGFPASLSVLATAVRGGFDLPFVVASPDVAPDEPPVDPPVEPPADDPEFYDLWAEIEVEDDEVEVEGGFTLGEGNNGINLAADEVTVGIGEYTFTIPAGSFDLDDDDEWEFEGVIGGVEVEMEIELVSGMTFEFEFEVEGTTLDLENPVEIALTIGDDSGKTTATAEWDDDDDDARDDDDEEDDD